MKITHYAAELFATNYFSSKMEKNIKYSRTCYEQLPLRHRKSGLLTQLAAHRRLICIQNAILGNDQVASHRRLAAHSKFYCRHLLKWIIWLTKQLIQHIWSISAKISFQLHSFSTQAVKWCQTTLRTFHTTHATHTQIQNLISPGYTKI